MELNDFYKKIELLELKYRKMLNLEGSIRFGIEIEFVDALFNQVFNYINDNINYIGSFQKKNYTIWNLTVDDTVQEIYDDKLYGGEIVSPILGNDIDSWKQIKNICECFKIYNFNLNGNASFHAHFDKNVFSNPDFQKNLLKMWMLYEDIIYRFSYGRTAVERKSIFEYAKPTNIFIYENLSRFNDLEDFNNFIVEYSKSRKLGLSFYNLLKEKQTYEIRCANGLENDLLIQNTLNMYAHLLLYCNSSSFDSEYIDNKIKKFSPMFLPDFRNENLRKAISFSNLIFSDQIDRVYFLKQYLKCLEGNDCINEGLSFVKSL